MGFGSANDVLLSDRFRVSSVGLELRSRWTNAPVWLVRADQLPLMLTVMGAAGLMRGDKVKVKLGAMDTMALDLSGTVIEKINNSQAASADADENLDDTMDDLEDSATGPIAIALNVNEAPTEDAPTPS